MGLLAAVPILTSCSVALNNSYESGATRIPHRPAKQVLNKSRMRTSWAQWLAYKRHLLVAGRNWQGKERWKVQRT